MSNTLPSITSVKHLAGLVTSARSVLPRLESFATIQTIATDPELSSEIPIVSDVGTVQTSSFDYEASNVVIDSLHAVPKKFALPFSVGSADMQSAGLDVRQLVQAALERFEAAIWDTAIAPLFAESNFGVAASVGAEAFAASDFETMLASVSGRERAAVLDTDYSVKVKSTWLPVTPTTVSESSRWTAAGDGVKGFVTADRRGLIVKTGLPLVSPNPGATLRPRNRHPARAQHPGRAYPLA